MENETKHPYISIVIPCYNYGHLLGRALDGCAGQSFRDFEIILVNDGSTDNTEEVYRIFCSKNPDILTNYLHVQPNQGVSHARNEGIKLACGEYVLFHDADDYLEPNGLELLAQKARETGADRVTPQYQEVLPDGTVYRVRAFGKKNARFMTADMACVMFRRAVILEHQLCFLETLSLAEDICFTYNFAIEEKRFEILRKTVYNVFLNSESVTRKNVKDLEKYYNTGAALYVGPIAKAIDRAKDAKLRAEMEYRFLRFVFGSIVSAYQNCDKQIADQFYLRVRSKLQDELPKYYKNPMLWNLNNGCPGGWKFNLACLVIAVLDRFKAKGMIRIAAIMGQSSSLSIKKS